MNIILLIIGILMSSIGLMFIYLYINLLTIGYSFWNFVKFIITRFECLLFLFGIVVIFLSIERWLKNAILLRHST